MNVHRSGSSLISRAIASLLVTAIAFCVVCPTSSSSDDPKAVLARLQERYDSLKDLEVSYKQEVHSGVFSTVERTTGRMLVAAGDKFRIESAEQTIVSDGIHLWVYSPENKQVTIDKVSKSQDIVRPSDYLFSFRESYTASMLADTAISKINCSTVELKCVRRDEFIQRMKLYIGKEDLLTHRAVYLDVNGNRVEIDFSDMKVDKGLPPDRFTFKTPKGVEEIRLP